MLVDLFDYELPPDRIAQHPATPRDSSRLLVLDRQTGRIEHRVFREIGEYLRPGDVLVVNNTRVLSARLLGRRAKTGGKWEGLFLREFSNGWEILTQTRGKPEPGERIEIDSADWQMELISKTGSGTWLARPTRPGSPIDLLTTAGHVPLPPYIRGGLDEPADRERYQTVFASAPGAIAAPTAGLHFTPELIARLRESGVQIGNVTLHVGPGTFLPVTAQDTADHAMHSEWCELSQATADTLLESRRAGARILAVGTTVVRTLESAIHATGALAAYSGPTNLFITPPYQFRAVDVILTNFHLPRSTLLMLVSAFAGRERILDAYREAIQQGYRFYSYGDAMLIL